MELKLERLKQQVNNKKYAGRSCALMREHILPGCGKTVSEAVRFIANHFGINLDITSEQQVIYNILDEIVQGITAKQRQNR